MRTMLTCSLLIMAVLRTSSVAMGDDKSHRKAAETLLIVTQVEKSLPKIVEQVLASQLQQNLQLTPYRDVMQRFLNKDMNWESLKDDVITASTQEFTEQALKQLTVFYKTPLSQKAVAKMPKLLFIGGQIGMQRGPLDAVERGCGSLVVAQRLPYMVYTHRDNVTSSRGASQAVVQTAVQGACRAMPHDDLLQHESLVQPADAIEMLKADHRRVHKLFQSYEATNEPAMKHRIAMALFVALALHTQMEETVFYPAFAEATTRAGHALVDTSLEDHEHIEVCIEELRGLEADSEAFAAQFHALRLTVEQHVQHEERQLFPQAEVALATQLEDLRDEMQDIKDLLLG